MELQAITGQLYVVEGHAQPGTAVPGMLAQAAPPRVARNRERDFLFVHLTLSGQTDETAEIANQMVQAISNSYYKSAGSVTAALRRAVVEINDWLLRRNLNSHDKRHGALTVAALRQGELYMVQVGEALALLGHNFGVERLPAQPPDHIVPLGQSAGANMRYFHHRLESGDMLLLAEPRLARLSSTALMPALVDTEVEAGLSALLDIIGSDTGRLLLVEFARDVPAGVPELSHVTQTTAPNPVAPPPPPQPRRATATPAEPAAEKRPSLSPPPLPTVDLDAVETSARRAASRSALGLSRFTIWLAELLTRLRPTGQQEADESSRAWTFTMLMAIFIPILVAVVGTGVYFERGRVREFGAIKVQMAQYLEQARTAGEVEADQRQAYEAVLLLAAEASTLNPADSDVLRMRTEATEALDQLDGVKRLQARPLYTYADGTQLTAVTLRDTIDGGIYTLDSANNAIYLHETDSTYMTLTSPDPNQLAFDGMAVGNRVVTRLIDLMWRPQGEEIAAAELAALDASGVLFAAPITTNQLTAAPLGLASEWEAPTAIATYDERLYVLDVGAARIWKYFPEGDQFTTSADDRVVALGGTPDLQNAVDFKIYVGDASLLVVYRDGRIRYYDTRTGDVQWNETDLLANGLDQPLVAPVSAALVGSGINASIYIADPGSGRIVHVSRVGIVLAQYRATDEQGRELFTTISDFAIPSSLTDATFRILAVRDNVLYLVTLD